MYEDKYKLFRCQSSVGYQARQWCCMSLAALYSSAYWIITPICFLWCYMAWMTKHNNIYMPFSEFKATLLSNLADILLLCKPSKIISAVNICDTPLKTFHPHGALIAPWVQHTTVKRRQAMLQLHRSDEHFFANLGKFYIRGLKVRAMWMQYDQFNQPHIQLISIRLRIFEELSNRLVCFCVLFWFNPCPLGLPHKFWDNIVIGLVLVELQLRI